MRSALGRVLFFAALTVVAIVLVLARGGDGLPPDDADLMAEPAPPPDHENAFFTLSAAAALLDWPGDEALTERLREIAAGGSWDPALVAHTLATNERALATFERASRLPAFRSPDRETRPAEMGAWMDLARLQALRAIALARAGDGEGAIAAALTCLRLSRIVEADSNGSRVTGLVATEIGASGLGALRAVFTLVAFPRERNREVAAELAGFRIDPVAWRGLLAAEYRERAPTVAPGPTLVDVPEEEAGLRLLALLLPESHLYQPNNTRAVYASVIRQYQGAAEEPCENAPAAPARATLRSLLQPNLGGRQLVDETLAPTGADHARCRFDTRIETVRAALGVQAFEREQGALPGALDALVPDYLSEAPRDWFAGGSLRLDPGARELVSFGFWDAGESAAAREQRFPLLPPSR